MNDASRYRQGQRWRFEPSVAEFEDTLVIGAVIEAHPAWGWNERKYEVYVRYSDAAKASIPFDYDGTTLSLTDEGLGRSVSKLVSSDVELPWWWVYGRRFKSQKDAPGGRGSFSCDRVSDVLPLVFQSATQVAEMARARREALEAHREKFGSKRAKPTPTKSVSESWERIEAWFAENAHSITSSLAPGASAARIKKFEEAIGARLPGDFKESVSIHDGGGWWVPWRHGDLLSLEQILEQWKMYFGWQAKGGYATDDWRADEIKGPIKRVFWNKKRIYVTDNSGDHLTLDLEPPADGTYGQVIDHCHEVGPKEVIAAGWGEFLCNLVKDLESGKYVYLPAEGSLELVEEVERELE
jgi:cell wall assembly regulator SMI1